MVARRTSSGAGFVAGARPGGVSGAIKAARPEVRSIIAAASGAQADVKIGHGDRIEFGSMFLEVRATPGHTDGCLSYVCDDMVFTGDAVLIRGCG